MTFMQIAVQIAVGGLLLESASAAEFGVVRLAKFFLAFMILTDSIIKLIGIAS